MPKPPLRRSADPIGAADVVVGVVARFSDFLTLCKSGLGVVARSVLGWLLERLDFVDDVEDAELLAVDLLSDFCFC